MTKKRVCIIGNSHIGAVKLAWDETSPDFQTFDPTFFGSLHFQMDDLNFENGRFFAGSSKLAASMKKTSGGLTEFEVGQYDAFVLVGLGLRFRPVRYYASYRLLGDASDRHPPMSPACLSEIVRDEVRVNLTTKIGTNIRSASDAPMLILPTPHPSIDFLNAETLNPKWLEGYREMVVNGSAERLYPFFLTAIAALASELNAVLLNQPVKTVERTICLKTEYSRLVSPQGDADFLHANTEYGRLVLGQIKSALAKFEDAAESKPKLRRAG